MHWIRTLTPRYGPGVHDLANYRLKRIGNEDNLRALLQRIVAERHIYRVILHALTLLAWSRLGSHCLQHNMLLWSIEEMWRRWNEAKCFICHLPGTTTHIFWFLRLTFSVDRLPQNKHTFISMHCLPLFMLRLVITWAIISTGRGMMTYYLDSNTRVTSNNYCSYITASQHLMKISSLLWLM